MEEKIIFYLRNLVATHDSIIGTAKFISAYPTKSNEITKILQTEFDRASQEQKVLYFYLMHEIMFDSKEKNDNFVKSFGLKYKILISQIMEIVDDEQQIKNMIKLIDIWEKSMIYVSSFCDKLKQIMMEKLNKLRGNNYQLEIQPNAKENSNNIIVNKAFIRDYKLIQDNHIAKQNYQIKLKESEYSSKMTLLNKMFNVQEINKRIVDAQDNEDQKNEIKRMLANSKKQANDCKDLLLGILTDYGQNYKEIIKQIESQKDSWIDFNMDEYERIKSQYGTRPTN